MFLKTLTLHCLFILVNFLLPYLTLKKINNYCLPNATYKQKFYNSANIKLYMVIFICIQYMSSYKVI